MACGALVRELRAVIDTNGWNELDATYLPAPLHNRPEQIVPRVLDAVAAAGPDVTRVIIGYADCGTGGRLDAAVAELRSQGLTVDRLPGDHCYELFAGSPSFRRLHDEELGTLFLTDYLARHFDLIVWQGLGLDDHPELLPAYFGNYRRVVLLTQSTDPATVDDLVGFGRAAAERLGLDFEHHPVGLEPFAASVTEVHLGAGVA